MEFEENEEIRKYKLKNCLNCEKSSDLEDLDELFCQGCGSPLINRCSDYKCDNILPAEAAFCKYCGSQSTFFNLNLVKPTKAPKIVEDDFDDLPF